MASTIPQHKALAMGKAIPAFAKGGGVPFLKSGKPMSPVTKAKAANGIPGFKAGGKTKDKC